MDQKLEEQKLADHDMLIGLSTEMKFVSSKVTELCSTVTSEFEKNTLAHDEIKLAAQRTTLADAKSHAEIKIEMERAFVTKGFFWKMYSFVITALAGLLYRVW